jgi:hypothetical protein
VKKGNAYGVVAHVMIAVDAESHACLGLVGGDVQTRDGVVTEHHRDRPLSERESRRWVETAERAKNVLASAAMVTVVADRESDIYPAWASVPQADFHLLSRAMLALAKARGGQATCRRRQSVQRRREFRGGRHTQNRSAGPSAGSGRPYRHGGDAVWRGRNPPPTR